MQKKRPCKPRGKVWTSSRGQQGVLKGFNSRTTWLHCVEDLREGQDRWQGEHYEVNAVMQAKDGGRNSR